MTSVAFLGLGDIGRPMARHLARDPFRLKVWNRTPQRAASFAQEVGGRATVAATPADAVRGVDVIVTCLSTSHDVESIMDGEGGMLSGVSRGQLFVDCTSGDPATSRRIAHRLAEEGISFIDAPVSGGTSGAEQGKLTIMVGGDAAALERARPVLSAFGERIVHCGDIGAGDAVKAVNNALLAVHIISAAEGLAALAKMGVSPGVALQVINASSGRSNSSENLIPKRVLTREFPRTFKAALLDKDIGIAADIAREQRTPAMLLQLAREMYRVTRNQLDADADHVEVVRILEKWAGVEIK